MFATVLRDIPREERRYVPVDTKGAWCQGEQVAFLQSDCQWWLYKSYCWRYHLLVRPSRIVETQDSAERTGIDLGRQLDQIQVRDSNNW
jgi:hypothetical protein